MKNNQTGAPPYAGIYQNIKNMQTVNSLLFKLIPSPPTTADGNIGIRITWTVYGRGLIGAPQLPITN